MVQYYPGSKAKGFIKNGQWPETGMQEGKPAKTIRKLFTPRALKLLTDWDFELFDNAYKSWFRTNMIFEVLPNKHIGKVYDMEIAPGHSSLSDSCMNGKSGYMDIYMECAALRILILKRPDGLLLGRALVWQLEEIVLMDRIYVVDDYMYDCFIAYAKRNKWWYKQKFKSRLGKTSFINGDGIEVEREFQVKTRTSFQYWPYIDTFTYGDGNSLNNYKKGPFEYETTDGIRSGSVFDEIRNTSVPAFNAVQIESGDRLGQFTHRDNTVFVNGQYWWKDDPALQTKREIAPMPEMASLV